MTTMNTTELIDGNVSPEHLALIDKYSGRKVDSLQYDGDSGYIIVRFKDEMRVNHVFKVDIEDEGVSQQIEQELNRIHFELTEDNEEEVLEGVVSVWVFNGILTPFAELYDTEVDASQTVTAWTPEPKSDAEVAHDEETGD